MTSIPETVGLDVDHYSVSGPVWEKARCVVEVGELVQIFLNKWMVHWHIFF